MNISNKKNFKISKIKYIYMMLMVLWSAKTTILLKIGPENLTLSFLYLIIIGFYFNKYCAKKTLKPIKIIYTVFCIWYILICIKFDDIQPLYWSLFINTFIVYIAYYVYKRKEFFIYAEKVLLHLCCLSLVVWSLFTLTPSIVGGIMDFISVGNNGATMRANFFLVGIGSQPIIDGMSITRNIGFTWEGGRFSCYIIFAIFLNLTINRMSISFLNNKSLYIFLVTLISTFSTTGIISLTVIIIYYIYNISIAHRTLIITFCWLIAPTIWGLSFIGEKIEHLIDYEYEISHMMWRFDNGIMTEIVPQRFTGLYLEFQNLIHDFWLGYNLNENSYATSELFKGYKVFPSNGTIQIFSMYGIFIGLFFYYLLFKSSNTITKLFQTKGKYCFALMFLTISLSYEFWTSCICLYCIYYYLFTKHTLSNKLN